MAAYRFRHLVTAITNVCVRNTPFPPTTMLALYTLAFGILHASSSIAAVLDCNELISVGGHDYNIAGLAKQSAYANQTRETPPTKVEDSLQISLCEGLPRKEGVSEEDQVGSYFACGG
jgi:hypothetical protein